MSSPAEWGVNGDISRGRQSDSLRSEYSANRDDLHRSWIVRRKIRAKRYFNCNKRQREAKSRQRWIRRKSKDDECEREERESKKLWIRKGMKDRAKEKRIKTAKQQEWKKKRDSVKQCRPTLGIMGFMPANCQCHVPSLTITPSRHPFNAFQW